MTAGSESALRWEPSPPSRAASRSVEPGVGLFERECAPVAERLDLLRADVGPRRLVEQGVERLPVARTREVELEERRLADRILVEPGQVDDQRRFLDAAFERLHGEEEFQVTAAEGADLVGDCPFVLHPDQPVDEAGVMVVEIEPEHDPMSADRIAQVRLER